MTKVKSREEPICVIGSNIDRRNRHWRLCQRVNLPYINILRSTHYSFISWDLWTIDVPYLGLNKESVKKLDEYIEGLFATRECRVACLHVRTVGYLKVKRNIEQAVLATIWTIVSNPNNWDIDRKGGDLFDENSEMFQVWKKWLSAYQMGSEQ